MIDQIRNDFLMYMASNGVNIDTNGGHPIADGKMHNISAIGKGKPNKHAYYVLYADDRPTGVFGDHQLGIRGKWKGQPLRGDVNIDELRAMVKLKADQRVAESIANAKIVAVECDNLIRSLPRASSHHPYLVNKGVGGTSLVFECDTNRRIRVNENGETLTLRANTLIIPIFINNKEVSGVQSITDAGKKYYVKGMAKDGGYHHISGDKSDPSKFMFICEGWATGATIHYLTGMAVVCAFDAGNLSRVANKMRDRHPKSRIIISADNDRLSHVGDIENPGVHFATLAAMDIHGSVVYPSFPDGAPGSDYNDLFNEVGYDEALKQIKFSVKSSVDL